MKYFLTFAFFILSILFNTMLYSQKVIIGNVLNEQNESLDLVHVVLKNNIDSSFIAGGAFKFGNFGFDNISNSKVLLTASYVGYREFRKTINCNVSNDTIKLEPIYLQEIILNEVSINAFSPRFQPTDRGFKMSINKKFEEHHNDAIDLLKMMPGIVATENSIAAFNKDNLVIYIDKEKINNHQELASLEPNEIKNIELIESPGSEFDNDVDAVLIITRKNKISDYTKGWIQFYREYDRKLSGHESLSLKSKFKNFRYEIYGTNHNNKKVNHIDDHTFYQYGDDSFTNTTHSKLYEKMRMKYGHTRLAYENKKHLLSSKISVLEIKNGIKQYTNIQDLQSDREYDQYKFGALYSFTPNSNSYYDFTLNYSKYKNYSKSDDNASQSFSNSYESNLILTKFDGFLKFSNSETKLRYGGKYLKLSSEDTYSDENSSYDEEKISTYASLSKKIGKKISVNGGIRFEHLIVKNAKDKKQYDFLLPSFRVMYSIAKRKNLSFSYKRKMRNPKLSEIQNNLIQVDFWTYEKGNPSLEAFTSDLFEISYLSKRFKTNIGAKINRDFIESNFFVDLINLEPVIIEQRINLKRMNEYYLSSSYSLDNKWFSSYTTASINYSENIKRDDSNYNYWSFKLKNTTAFRFIKTYTVTLSTLYLNNRHNGYVEYDDRVSFSASLSKRFLKKKLLAKIGVRDIFKSNAKDQVLNYNNIATSRKYLNVQSIGYVSLKWSFGKAKVKSIKSLDDNDLNR
ncbi:outer membrane beta-barrel protein [Marinifilum sp. N1E240]|uniref:outer membrane beta-barrel protein n=1 Tax=Marinifilum sp. N1E240 TaxID=2608082 RepID=UPI00128D0076|nr:outer membrane beta-barrel protein [Marinifilum sp. N1E240]MPQ48125.1 outer membrane beta-barrel protein [Marinifilum sp. N1E240]